MILVQEGGNENKNFGLLQEEEEGAVVKWVYLLYRPSQPWRSCVVTQIFCLKRWRVAKMGLKVHSLCCRTSTTRGEKDICQHLYPGIKSFWNLCAEVEMSPWIQLWTYFRGIM
jgi:hypothetical protein